ncbi:hypothetical protein AB0395_20350 [Streptosporangium sp. NPDC051023]|uniref:hypothetical protein n=1 Tax=Streptosporangium sp. NPDC051023 TaxID=3155410 RepID=UPI00344CB417
MTPPILDQRSRGELITELYDKHAAGLFAYCHDQLGDPESAAAALAAVFTGLPAADAEPPRAALYALARREIHQRNVLYASPAPSVDPVSAFVERVLRDLRPHQREVLYLSGVREMDTAELSWVLDVAADTADELTVSACRRFAQSLELALASARVPAHLADAFGALSVAPIRDVLVRAPWAVPPAALRGVALAPRPGTALAAPPSSTQAAASVTSVISVTPLKPLWPTPPTWPLPLTETDPLTSTSVFPPPELPPPFSPADFFPPSSSQDRFPDPFSPPDPDVVSAHEATTAPMPKLKDSVLSALDEIVPRSPRRKLQRPKPRRAMPLAAPPPADVLDDALRTKGAGPGDASPAEDLFQPFTPEPRARPHTDKLVASAPRDEVPDTETTLPGWPLRAEELDATAPGLREPLAARPTLPDWPLRADELGTPMPGDRARHAKRPGTRGAGEQAEAERTGRAERPGLHRASHGTPPADDVTMPGSTRPDTVGADVLAPETAAFGITRPDILAPETAGFDVTRPDTAGHDVLAADFPGIRSPQETSAADDSRPGDTEATWRPDATLTVSGGQAGEARTAEPWSTADRSTETRTAADRSTARTAADRGAESQVTEDPDAEDHPEGTLQTAGSARSARQEKRARRRRRQARKTEQHHDWAWELFGFVICVICVAIAMLVFFAVPTIVTP